MLIIKNKSVEKYYKIMTMASNNRNDATISRVRMCNNNGDTRFY